MNEALWKEAEARLYSNVVVTSKGYWDDIHILGTTSDGDGLYQRLSRAARNEDVRLSFPRFPDHRILNEDTMEVKFLIFSGTDPLKEGLLSYLPEPYRTRVYENAVKEEIQNILFDRFTKELLEKCRVSKDPAVKNHYIYRFFEDRLGKAGLTRIREVLFHKEFPEDPVPEQEAGNGPSTGFSKVIVLDTETTGFGKDAEVLQLSVVDGEGETLFNEYFRPVHTESWAEAMAVNHITPEMTADKPPLLSKKREIETIIQDADLVVGYNIGFDMRMLTQNGIEVDDQARKYFDVMDEFKTFRRRGKWCRLSRAAAYYGIHEDNLHNSLSDARLTAACFRKLKEDLCRGECSPLPVHKVTGVVNYF